LVPAQDPSGEVIPVGVAARALELVINVEELDEEGEEDGEGDGESDDETESQLPNCGWHPVPQYAEEVPQ
jgi:hypothetical protein